MGNKSFLEQLLEEQADLTAVERFSKAHDEIHEVGKPVLEDHYKELMPSKLPGQGEQYAFEVDLAACTGCKACVVGCHHMNGLSEDETWREVNTLKTQNGPPSVQHLTSSCHHCVEPGCATGCPVQAYEKDEETGVVYHLDDQCIGCRYCELKCPYEVPQFNESLGIVRKCDMCIGRLKEGEAPACVQSCPNEAIKITLVSQEEIMAEKDMDKSLPGNPSSFYTTPTTQYLGKENENLIETEKKPNLAHGHLPLAIMLPMTQIGFGLLMVSPWTGKFNLLMGWVALLVGLGVAPMHLGRPKMAWKAFLGMRTSWLSREMLAFGPFAGLASLWVGLKFLPEMGMSEVLSPVLGYSWPIYIGMAVTGAISVICSGMIYVDTPRPLWRYGGTLQRFFTTVFIGFSAGASYSIGGVYSVILMGLAFGLKIYFESLAYRKAVKYPELIETVTLMREKLMRRQKVRWSIYGILLLLTPLNASLMLLTPWMILVMMIEVDERHDFFRAGIAPGDARKFKVS